MIYICAVLAVDGDHVWNFGVRQRVGFDLTEPAHPWLDLRVLEDQRHGRGSFAHEVAHDSTQRSKQRHLTSTTAVGNSRLQ